MDYDELIHSYLDKVLMREFSHKFFKYNDFLGWITEDSTCDTLKIQKYHDFDPQITDSRNHGCNDLKWKTVCRAIYYGKHHNKTTSVLLEILRTEVCRRIHLSVPWKVSEL